MSRIFRSPNGHLFFVRLLSAFLIASLGAGNSPVYALRPVSPRQSGTAGILAQSLGEEAVSALPATGLEETVPLTWLATTIGDLIAREDRLGREFEEIQGEIVQIRRSTGPAKERRLAALQRRLDDFQPKFLDGEKQLHRYLSDMTTDGNTTVYLLLEQVKNLFFQGRNEVPMGMVKVPFMDLKEMLKTYQLQESEDFPDDFKAMLTEELSRFAHATFQGGRIIVTDLDRDRFVDALQQAIAAAIQRVEEKYGPRIRGKGSVARRAQFLERLRNLPFYDSHVNLYLEKLPRQSPLPDPSKPREFRRALLRGKPKEVTPYQLGKLRPIDRLRYYTAHDRWLRGQRRKLSQATRYWMELSRQDVPGARANANACLELLMLDAWRRLDERLRPVGTALDPDYDPELSEAIREALQRPGVTGNIYLLDDEATRTITERLEAAGQRKLLGKFYELLQRGRRETVPISEYHTGNIPRLQHRIDLVQETLYIKVLDAVSALRDNPSQETLAACRDAYRLYSLALNEALVLASRDPRLPELHKMYWIDHVMQADAGGQWAQMREHLQQQLRRRSGQVRRGGRNPDRDNEVVRLRRLITLIRPGCYMVRRPEGDEVAGVLRVRAGYRIALTELRRGGTWLRFNPTDERDSGIQRINLGFLRAAVRQMRRIQRSSVDPVDVLNAYLEEAQGVIGEIAPRPFPAEEKVKEGNSVRRMPSFSTRTQPAARYAVSPVTGRWYYQDPDKQGRWIPLPLDSPLTSRQVRPEQAYLAATRIYYPHAVPLGEFRAMFGRLEYLVEFQKKNSEWDVRVMSSDEIAAAVRAGLEEDRKETAAQARVQGFGLQEGVDSLIQELLDGTPSARWVTALHIRDVLAFGDPKNPPRVLIERAGPLISALVSNLVYQDPSRSSFWRRWLFGDPNGEVAVREAAHRAIAILARYEQFHPALSAEPKLVPSIIANLSSENSFLRGDALRTLTALVAIRSFRGSLDSWVQDQVESLVHPNPAVSLAARKILVGLSGEKVFQELLAAEVPTLISFLEQSRNSARVHAGEVLVALASSNPARKALTSQIPTLVRLLVEQNDYFSEVYAERILEVLIPSEALYQEIVAQARSTLRASRLATDQDRLGLYSAVISAQLAQAVLREKGNPREGELLGILEGINPAQASKIKNAFQKVRVAGLEEKELEDRALAKLRGNKRWRAVADSLAAGDREILKGIIKDLNQAKKLLPGDPVWSALGRKERDQCMAAIKEVIRVARDDIKREAEQRAKQDRLQKQAEAEAARQAGEAQGPTVESLTAGIFGAPAVPTGTHRELEAARQAHELFVAPEVIQPTRPDPAELIPDTNRMTEELRRSADGTVAMLAALPAESRQSRPDVPSPVPNIPALLFPLDREPADVARLLQDFTAAVVRAYRDKTGDYMNIATAKQLLAQLLPSYDPNIPDVVTAEIQQMFQHDLALQLLAVGRICQFLQTAPNVYTPISLRITGPLRQVPYLDGRAHTWEGEATVVEGPSNMAGVSILNIALTNLANARAIAVNDHQQFLTLNYDPAVKAAYRQAVVPLRENQAEFERYFGELYALSEEGQHARDFAWACLFWGRDLHNDLIQSVLEADALILPGSELESRFWSVPRSRRDGMELWKRSRNIVELAGQLGGIVATTGQAVQDGRDDLALGLALRYLALKDVGIRTEGAPGTPSVANIFFNLCTWDGFPSHQALLQDFNAGPQPGRRAYERLKALYEANFRGEQNRLQLPLRAAAAGQEEALLQRKPGQKGRRDGYIFEPERAGLAIPFANFRNSDSDPAVFYAVVISPEQASALIKEKVDGNRIVAVAADEAQRLAYVRAGVPGDQIFASVPQAMRTARMWMISLYGLEPVSPPAMGNALQAFLANLKQWLDAQGWEAPRFDAGQIAAILSVNEMA